MITNKLNLPESFVKYATKDGDHEYKENRYSVTEILGSIREILLKRKYNKLINKDVSEMIPALFGTAVHSILEQNTPDEPHLKTEESIEYNFGQYTISGRIDLLDLQELSIKDYKTCSVSKISKADFEDWKLQGLAYALLVYLRDGIILKHLKFYALMKDWSKIKCANSANYPSSPIYVWEYEIKDSDFDYIEKYIKSKLDLIIYYNNNATLPECSDEERWFTGDKYAVYKKAGDKRAVIVCDTEDEAHSYITNKLDGIGEIEVRKGENTKCKYYCDVCEFCKRGENND